MPDDIATQIESITNPATTESTTGGSNNSAFIEEVQNRLLGQADIVSSADTNLEQSFADAISQTQRAGQASSDRVESQYNREIAFQRGEAAANIDTQLEGRRGFGTQMVALRRLVETTDKELKDLEQRKQELILQGESAAASRIAELQVQQLQFRQQAAQNTFSNLLGLGQFAQQQQSQNLAEKQFGLQTQQFKLAGVQLAMQASNDAFTRIGQLKELGALSGISSEERSQLEATAGLPSGTVEAIANVPKDREIRAVGDTLLAIDPQTLQTTVLYNAPSNSGGGGIDLGGGSEVSYLTSSVMNGLQSLDSLTPTQQAKVRAEMSKVGFGASDVPEWFRNKLQNKVIRPSYEDPNEPTGGQSLMPEVVQDEWQKYQESFVYGPRYLNEDFLRKMVPVETIEANKQDPDTYYRNQVSAIQAWRDAGLSDDEIAKTMGFRK